jgi:multicomponent Na+:H+ antiporter subunit E
MAWHPQYRRPWLHAAATFAVLFVFWALLSGYFTAFLLSAGAASAVAVLLLLQRMEVVDHEEYPIHLSWRAVASYWPWLAREIAVSAWTVTRIILRRRPPISPTLVRIRPSQKTAVGLVTHANSITLTPGTISIEVTPQEFLVHALTREHARDLAAGGMDRRVTKFEGTS